MGLQGIISREESLAILRNMLLKAALERRAAEIEGATPDQRKRLLFEIKCEVDDQVLMAARRDPGLVIF